MFMNPYDSLDRLHKMMKEREFPSNFYTKTTYTDPKSDKVKFKTFEDKTVAKVVAPGFKKDEITVTIRNDKFIIHMEANDSNPFNREYTEVSFEVDHCFVNNEVTMQLEDGILTINIPKSGDKESDEFQLNF